MVSFRFYIVLTIVIVVIASIASFLIGQMTAPVSYQPYTVWKTITQTTAYTYTQTIISPYTTETAKTTPQTTPREQLLAPIIDAAKREGSLIIYSTLDRAYAEPVLKAFQEKYPFIRVEYVELGSVALYNRYISERAAGVQTADILWSSGADLQYLLVLNNSAQPYRLTIYDSIPTYAKYKDLAYVTSYALVIPIYNTEKIPKELAPRSYSDILTLLTERKDLFPPRSIAVFNAEQSSLGLTFIYYQYKAEPDLMQKLFKAAGSIGVLLYAATGPQIEAVRTGQAVISLGLIGQYAIIEAQKDPRIGVIIPSDLVVLTPRVIFITKEAKNPNAAKLFLEFILSEEGQRKLGESAEVIIMGDNPSYPYSSVRYLQTHVKKLVICSLGDGILDELLRKDVRESFISMWKSWLGLG